MSEFVSFAPEREFRDDVAAAYEEVGGALRALLPRACLNHVGSTSVPGSLTKGDLDVCVLVSAAAFAEADAALASRYARNEGSDRSPTFSAFVAVCSVGGDGSIISHGKLAAVWGIPLMGVNTGRGLQARPRGRRWSTSP